MVKESKSLITRPIDALVPADPLKRYLAEVGKYPLLTDAQEKKLLAQYRKDADPEAARQLVGSHLRLVVKIAMEYRNTFSNLMDLIQEGNVGLVTAIKKYDPDKNTRLGYYATWWIRAFILKYILDNFRLVKIGTTKTQRKLFYNLMQEKRKIEALGIKPSSQMLAERLEVPKYEVEEMTKRLSQSEAHLDAPVGGADSDAILSDFIADDDVPIDEKLANEEVKDKFHEKLMEFSSELKPRELKIFQERLLAEVPLTLQQIGDEYGISKERARQIEERIIEKLRDHFKDSGMDISLLR
ncbi:MAG: RNA polymerase subunit sigma-70 [Deltaproteobacteria bacterium CG11_big_fil_rev_8_21_14_0_20_47_16]|nr:MAG: RNA polymerase subunit sigma-70 [Deltaproteobacteria bacterium CG11_big_fil_rev_8_21_14_0_20_47_16]